MREQLYLDWVDCCLVALKDQVKLNQIILHTLNEENLSNLKQGTNDHQIIL